MSQSEDASSLKGEDTELQKLRMLVQSLKKKYGEAVGESYSLEAKCRRLSEENSSLKETQTALSQKFNETLVQLQKLQEIQEKLTKEHALALEKADESYDEVKALTDQHEHLIASLKAHEEEAKKAQDDLQAVKLKETQLERVIQFLRKRAEEAHLETNQLTQEISQAQEQVNTLTKELLESSQEVRGLREKVTQLENSNLYEKEELKALQEQLTSLSTAFQNKSEESKQFESECLRLKSTLDQEISRYETLSKEHLFLKQSMMRSVDEAKEELTKAIASHEDTIKNLHEKATLQEKVYLEEKASLEKEIQQLKEKEAEAEKIWSMKASYDQKKQQLENKIIELNEQISLSKADHEETSQRFKTAQQHLAKKVRETAIANEKIETERLKSFELQNRLNAHEIKISELKNSLEMETEHQKRALARESELLKTAEAQVARLEEKYFEIHEKWRDAETEIRELRKVEEKWFEAEKLFSKMGPFASLANEPPRPKDPIETSIPLDSFTRSTPIKEEPPKRENVKESAREQSSLFEESRSGPRYKETFL